MVGCKNEEAKGAVASKSDSVEQQNAATDPSASMRGEKPLEDDICFEAQSRRIPVLMFHDLVAERGKGTLWYDCSIEEFETILQAIDIEGFTVISSQDLYDHLTTGKEVPEKSIVLTFDDNYQSFYDYAWPLLQKYKYPSTMFIHTGFVGSQTGRPKMTWDTLKELTKNELFTVGGHTINHYLDLAQRDITVQTKELEDSKKELESQLGITVDFLAYPNGSNGEDTQLLSRQAGYKMAYTIVNTPAEESPNIMAVGRYVHTKYQEALRDREGAVLGEPATIFRAAWNKKSKIKYVNEKFAGVPLRMTFGGLPSTHMSLTGREMVSTFVEREQAQAGINGGFFAMAAIQSTDNAMVGPLKTPEMSEVVPDQSSERWDKINGRPLVIWSGEEFAILPYIPAQMHKEEQFQWFMKGYTDTFMAGVWLVHNGVPQPRDFQDVVGAKDIQDLRRRAFIGITKDGQFVAGAAVTSVSSEKLAVAIAEAGVEEAVLIDSGFSTSLVFDGKIKASGHSSAKDPSRPVPHAITIKGVVDETTQDSEDLALEQPTKKKKRR
jgi:peptidoglycan/xylan/chitin deacetylase (PgdA/CDA1 family)